MQQMKNRRIVRSVSYIPIEDILPGVLQPRQHFSQEGLQELSSSIAEHGVIQPLTVRVRGDGFELIAGERRLRASRMAGLREVPCIIMDVDMEDSGLIALIENIQRKDLDFVEEAQGISSLIRLFGMSQEEAARRLGKSQSAIANKLRLLKLPGDVLTMLTGAGLGERHARVLLRLPTEDSQRLAAEEMCQGHMTVAEAEAYVEQLLSSSQETGAEAQEEPGGKPPAPKSRSQQSRHSRFIMKDIRLFSNSLSRSLEVMRKGGIDASVSRSENDSELIFTVHIPKK